MLIARLLRTSTPLAAAALLAWLVIAAAAAVPSATIAPAAAAPSATTGPTFAVTITPTTTFAFIKEVTLTVTALHADGTPNISFTGGVDINPSLSTSGLPQSSSNSTADYTFVSADAGTKTFPGFAVKEAGTFTVTVRNRADTTMVGTSNSITVQEVYLSPTITPGEIHAGVRGLTLTLEARDASGNLVPGYTGALDINPSTSTTGLPQSSSGFFADYTFTPADAGRRVFPNFAFNGDGQQTITVIDRGYTSRRGTSNIITVHPVSLTASISPEATFASNRSLTLTVEARDASGNLVPGYVGALNINPSTSTTGLPQSSSGFFADYTFTPADAGRHVFPNFAFNGDGQQTITVIDRAYTLRQGTSNAVTVHPVSLTASISPEGAFATDRSLTLTVEARDANGNLVPGYVGALDINPSTSTTGLPQSSSGFFADYTFTPADAGRRVFPNFAFNGDGQQTITVIDRGYTSRRGTSNAVTVQTVSLVATVSPTTAIAGVKSLTLTVEARDTNGNLVPAYRGELDINPSTATSGLPQSSSSFYPDYTFTAEDGGRHIFPAFSFDSGGSQTITIIDRKNTTRRVTTSPITVTDIRYQLLLTPTVTYAGERNLTVTLEVVDPNGQRVTDYRGSVDLNPSSQMPGLPQSTSGFYADYTFTAEDSGIHVFTDTGFVVPGAQTLTAIDRAYPPRQITSAPVNVMDVAFQTAVTPTTVVAGDPVTLTVKVIDPNTGATVTGYQGTVGISTTLPNSYERPYRFSPADLGTASLSFSFGATGTADVSVFDLDYLDRKSAPLTVSVTPPPAPTETPAGPAPTPFSVPASITQPAPIDPGWGLPIRALDAYGSNHWEAFPKGYAVPATPGVRYIIEGRTQKGDSPWWSTFYGCPYLAWENPLTDVRPTGGGLYPPYEDPSAFDFGLSTCSWPISFDSSTLQPTLSDPAPEETQGVHLDIHTGGNGDGQFAFVAVPFGDERDCDGCNPAGVREAFSAGDPVDTRTGEFYLTESDLNVPTPYRGGGLRFERSYNTLNFRSGALGVGWTHNYNLAVIPQRDDYLAVRLARGSYLLFRDTGGEVYVGAPGSRYTLLKRPEGGWALVRVDRHVDLFDSEGRLIAQQDPNGNLIWMTYQPYNRNGESGSRLARVDAPNGRYLWFGYDYYQPDRLIQVADHSGRTVQFGYDQAGFLGTVTDTLGGVTTYEYSDWLMVSKTDPVGTTVFTNTYDAAGRVIQQSNNRGENLTLSYVTSSDGITTTVMDGGGATTVYVYGVDGLLRQVIDPMGATTTYRKYTAQRVPTEIEDALGHVTRIGYNELAFPVVMTDTLGNRISFAYDEWGQLTAITDTLGRSYEFTYDGPNLVAIEDPAGQAVELYYGPEAGWQGLLTAIVNQAGITTTLGYNSAGDPSTVTDGLGNVTRVEYDDLGRPVRLTDARNSTSSFVYDAADRVRQVIDPLSGTVSFEYDAVGNLVRLTNQIGAITTITYSQSAWPAEIRDAHGGVVSLDYDVANRYVTLTNQLGKTSVVHYDLAGRPEAYVDPLGHQTHYGYDLLGRLTVITDARGLATHYEYDALGRLVTITDGAGNTTEYEYDAIGNQVVLTDALGYATHYEYDILNRLTAITDPLGERTEYGYNPLGSPTVITDALGFVTRYEYDVLNRLVTTIDPLGHGTRFNYDPVGNRIEAIDALGFATRYEYDALNRLVAITDPLTQTTRFGYDAAGRQTVITNTAGITTTATYDLVDRLVATTDGLGRTTQYEYDVLGRLTRVIDPAGRSTVYEYDDANRLTAMIENYRPPLAPDHQTNVRTEYTYDANGNLLTVTDANGHVTRYEYDARNLPVRSTDPLSNTHQMSYDPRGQLESVADALQQTTTYHYDALGQVIRIARPDETVLFEYDALGRRTAMTDTLGTTRFTFDPAGRLTAVLDPFNQQVGYEYDAAGNRTALIYPDGKRVTYAYDPLQRIVEVTDWQNQITSYTYDSANRLALALLPNGVTTSYTYDAADQLTGLVHALAGTPLARFDYTYDLLGNRGRVVEALEGLTTTIDYTYDPLSRLTGATATGALSYTYSYSYDAVGNRLSLVDDSGTTSYTYDAANRLTSVNGQTYTWDANGNLLSDGTRTYTYDSANRLVGVEQSGRTFTFAYNGQGDRLRQTVDGVTTTVTLDLGAKLSQVLADGNATYLYGLDRIGALESDGWRYYHADALGSVRLVTDPAGQVVGQASYAPFGAPLVGNTLSGAFGFTGEQTDATGLIYLRARYYDPAVGRFVSRDPFRGWLVQPESLHPYQYGYNNPVNFTDPSGRNPLCLALVLADGPLPVGDAGALICAAITGSIAWHAVTHSPASFTTPPIPLIPPEQSIGVLDDPLLTSPSSVVAPPTYNLPAINDGLFTTPREDICSVPQVTQFPLIGVQWPTLLWVQGPYSHLEDPPGVAPGKDFTSAQKRRILEENRRRNGGVIRSDLSGIELVPPRPTRPPKRGMPWPSPDPNEWTIDHIIPKSKGGTNSYSNAQVISRRENNQKKDKYEP